MRKASPRAGDPKPGEGTQAPDKGQPGVEWSQAVLQRSRHLKQAAQFVHKDSADLLPLDGLKRLGTSKDLQPHSVVQRRLLEENLPKQWGDDADPTAMYEAPPLRNKVEAAVEEGVDKWWTKSPTTLLIHCKCQGQLLRAVVNTGCQHNLISRNCLKDLGLQEVPTSIRNVSPCLPDIVGQVEKIEVQFGQEMVRCSALVVDDEVLDFCFGLQTLLSLRTCIDLNEGVLRLKALGQELPFIHLSEEQKM
ncbi:hypothetical protein lerEdw1_012000 [Lerista edwardsae]|nr:hypothetical protein lerEdw1_012000 [Lerista edwardsae]